MTYQDSKLPSDRVYTLRAIYEAEANNIALATIKYLAAPLAMHKVIY